jgi:dihydrofolate reductase
LRRTLVRLALHSTLIKMRKVILNLALSLDSLIEGPNGEYDWCFTDQDYGLTDFFKRIDTIFFGRKSYELVLQNNDHYFDSKKWYVFSTTLHEVKNKNATLINKDVAEAVDKIKNEPGKDIWLFGGASLVTTFINEGLVDQLELAVHPIILGSGKPLFQNISKRIQLQLTNSKTYSSGLVQLFYDVLK